MELLDPKLDVTFKMLFGAPENRDILTAFLRAVLDPPEPIVGVDVLNPEIPRTGRDEKGYILDLRVHLSGGMRIHVELQKLWHDAFFERALTYSARELATQLRPGASYEDLEPVVGILVLDFDPFGRPARFHHIFEILEERERFRLTAHLAFHVLALLNVRRLGAADAVYPVVNWGKFFLDGSDPVALERLAMQDPDIQKAKEALERLSRETYARNQAEHRRLEQLFQENQLKRREAKGKAEGKAESVLHILEARGIAVTPTDRDRILACTDLELLDHWLEKALEALVAAELFG